MSHELHRQLPTDDEPDPRVRALEEGAGLSLSDAHSKVHGLDLSVAEMDKQDVGEVCVIPGRRRRHRSPRADGDSDMDIHWHPEYTGPLSEEQMEINKRGSAQVRQVLAALALKRQQP